MRTPKLPAVFVFLLIGLTACEKSEGIEQEKLFLIGDYPEAEGFIDLSPDKTIHDGFLGIDINQDTQDDIRFWTDHMVKPDYSYFYACLEIMDSAIQFAATPDSMNPVNLAMGDTLNRYPSWKSREPYLGPKVNFGNETLKATLLLLENRNFEFRNDYSDYWNEQVGYIGFRRKGPNDTYSYGWMKIGLAAYHEFTLYEYYYDKPK